MATKLPDGPIGEAWVLSDRPDHASRISDGPLAGRTITELMATAKTQILGRFAERFDRFPLLLKFLDVAQMLSVQVHPRDDATAWIPDGERGKTEAWIVLEAEPGGRIYAGLKSYTTADDLRALTEHTADDHLASFTPEVGQAVLIEAGTVHALGDGVMVFEVQENSDITFRLYDWDHIDKTTGKPRDLQVEQALACVDFDRGAVLPVVPKIVPPKSDHREKLIEDDHFIIWRIATTAPVEVGTLGEPRILVCVGGEGVIVYAQVSFAVPRGAVMLLPASVGRCSFHPGFAATLLEIGIPERAV
ncbi:type I phosphomannose isomerase catalytic subunit [Glacieibacterium megasporae]|uniref:type I phosphomannose isomerase catalytic subunit n=1 Tax=Glacieibacterium megasporae TaxID=2835787 RepID=UPI00210761B3|nr:type I phosphomannose isomerase catalytic subunit [Polymorphobacter megasporae]